MTDSNKAETVKLMAEARMMNAEAEKLEKENVESSHLMRNFTVYPFFGAVTDQSVHKALHELEARSRAHPGEPITILFNCPGGSVLDGLALFDYLRELSARGHHITTKVVGVGASMASILLQAGDERVMTPNAYIMIHEISGSSGGMMRKTEHENLNKFLGKLEEHGNEILASRSKMTPRRIKAKVTRGDLWMNAKEALDEGLIDRIEG